MKKILLIYCVVATVAAVAGGKFLIGENRRLKNNQSSLSQEVLHYRTRLGQEAASVQALRLRCSEFETLRADDTERIRQLGIRLRRLETAGKSVTRADIEARAPLRDTIVVRLRDSLPVYDTARRFRWEDAWVTVEGVVRDDSVLCRVRSIDTLRQVVHRIPRRFLFIRWGTKALRQEIVSSNPHTRIIYTEYVQIER